MDAVNPALDPGCYGKIAASCLELRSRQSFHDDIYLSWLQPGFELRHQVLGARQEKRSLEVILQGALKNFLKLRHCGQRNHLFNEWREHLLQ